MRISDWSSDVCSSDLLAFNAADLDEVISSGRSLDYAEKIYLTTGDTLYSNRSNPQLEIVEDSVGRHDFLLTPCSVDTFRSEEHTSELQSLMRISYAVFCLKKKTDHTTLMTNYSARLHIDNRSQNI